jgi:DNA-binding response OmpR family regulator
MNYLSPAPSSHSRGHGSVLVIENDPMVCDALHDILSEFGYTVFVAHDGIEGEEMYRSMKNDIGVVILDWRLPRQNGRDTLLKIRQVNAQAQIMVSTGFTEKDVTDQLSKETTITFLGKPFNISSLLSNVEKMIA